MPSFWKVLVGLLIALPMAAYIAGSFAASSPDEPAPRDPVRISDVREGPGADQEPGGKDPSPPPSRRTPVNGEDDDGQDEEDVRVVTPKPTRVDGDDGDGPEGDDDDSRHGGDDSDDGAGD